MSKIIIDAHSHLWLRQDAKWNKLPIKTLQNGRSFFLTEERQMLPPFMIDGINSAEVFLSNMNYAQVGGAVVVQELIDGLQNDYLEQVQHRYPDRFRCLAMCDYFSEGIYQQAESLFERGFCGLAIPGHRLITSDRRIYLNDSELMLVYALMEQKGLILSLTLAENGQQIDEMRDVISSFPNLKIAIGHFGLAPLDGWKDQIMLARNKNVMIESGGMTWLFNDEFYPFPSAVKVIREAIDMVGAEKLMWGSDYPRTITAITYRMSYDFLFRSKLLNERELDLFLGFNAKRFYNFGELPELRYIKNMSE